MPGQTGQTTQGQQDKQTLFYRTLLATARGPTSTAVVEWHLKVKDTEYNVCRTKNYYMTVGMQKISSIHKLSPKNRQILRLHEPNGCARFLTTPTQQSPKWLLAFLNLPQHSKKISSFHQFTLEIWSILGVPWPDWLNPFLIMPTQKILDQLLTYGNLYEHAKNQSILLICPGMVD